jgi:prepilin-type N-terminal cleavage/methylation domain-containing protein
MKIGLKKGFTLIELLIVIAIIGILAVALLPTILGAPAKGRDTARKAQLSSISTAIEARNLEKSGYPTGIYCLTNDLSVLTNATMLEVKALAQGGSFPIDPLGSIDYSTGPIVKTGTSCRGTYVYGQGSGTGGKNYWLASFMELPSNANALFTTAAIPTSVPAAPALPTDPVLSTTAITSCTPLQASGTLVATSCVYVMQK